MILQRCEFRATPRIHSAAVGMLELRSLQAMRYEAFPLRQ